MHILSELRTPLFDAPDRQRALRALQMSRILRENNGAKAWRAVRNMIDKAVAEHTISPQTQPQRTSSYSSPVGTSTFPPNFEPPISPSNGNVRVYPSMGRIPDYALHTSSERLAQQTQSPQEQPMQAQTDLMQPMQTMQSMQDQTAAPCWDDINLNNINNIVGDMQPNQNVMPDFDFVSSVRKH